MLKNKKLRRLVLLISLVMLLTYTVNTSFGFIVTKTDSLTNNFVPTTPEPDDITVNITVNKTVKNTGDLSIGPDGFNFILENITSGEKQILTSDDNGKAIFALPFTAADIGNTYTYILYEINNGIDGVTYDNNVYDISVFVTLGSDNKLIAIFTMDGNKVDTIVAEFENTYYVKRPIIPPTGDNSNITLWYILLIISGTACAILIVIYKKHFKKY